MFTYLQELSSSIIDLSQSHSSTRTENVFRRNWTSFRSSSPFCLSFIHIRILCPADDTRNQIFKVPIKGSLFHINSNFGSTVGDTLVFVYSRCWKTCLTFLNMFLSLMEDIDIKQIESFFEGFLKYT